MGNTNENLQSGYLPIKYGSPLWSKLQKKYWQHSHLKNKPLILALHDYHQPGSMVYSETTLREYLYGIKLKKDSTDFHIKWEEITEHRWKEKTIPSGFFNLKDAEHISAVLLASTATIGKFNRMGKLAGLGGEDHAIFREGVLRDPNPDSTKPIPFVISISDPAYHESWSESIIMFHNPKAKNPINWDLFPNISHLTFDNKKGFQAKYVPYDVIASFTLNIKF